MPQKGDLENLTRVAHDVLKASPATQIIEKSVAGVEGGMGLAEQGYKWARRKVRKYGGALRDLLPAETPPVKKVPTERSIPPAPTRRTTDIHLPSRRKKR